MVGHQNLCNRTAQPPVEYIVFSSNDGAGLAGSGQNGIHIQGFKCMAVDDADIQPSLGQMLGGDQRLDDQVAVGNDGRIAAIPQCDRLADFKRIVKIKDGRRGQKKGGTGVLPSGDGP